MKKLFGVRAEYENIPAKSAIESVLQVSLARQYLPTKIITTIHTQP
jgi:hypothetical protein